MKKQILDKLHELEHGHEITFLYACESGSRAWGFPSPDSDFDVRAIYKHKLDWYIALAHKKDTIENISGQDLDISAWDIGKTLKAVYKSNASPLEWVQSSIVYKAEARFVERFVPLVQQYFSPIALMNHYLSMARKYLKAIDGQEMVRLKSYFYAIRTVLAGVWIREKLSVPPLEIKEMLEVTEPWLTTMVQELVELKKEKNEDYHHRSIAEINDFLHSSHIKNEASAQCLPASGKNLGPLDEFYREVVVRG